MIIQGPVLSHPISDLLRRGAVIVVAGSVDVRLALISTPERIISVGAGVVICSVRAGVVIFRLCRLISTV